jgi:hypothetical protein
MAGARHVLRGIEEILCAIAGLSELVTYIPWSGPLDLGAPPFHITVDAVEFLHKGIKLLLLLMEGGLTSKDERLALALVLFFLIGVLLVPSAIVIRRGHYHETDHFRCFFSVVVNPGRAAA